MALFFQLFYPVPEITEYFYWHTRKRQVALLLKYQYAQDESREQLFSWRD